MLIQAPQTGQKISKTSVNLRGVAACRRLINAKTGTALNKNFLNAPDANAIGQATANAFVNPGFGGHGFSGGAGSTGSSINIGSLMGMNPANAMSGGSVGGSGLGQGADTSSVNYGATNMGQNYLSMNSSTGILEKSPSNGGTTVHYGGVTIPITLPKDSQIDPHQLASMIKTQLMSINIHAKVASS
jgi:hypothetical protein